MIFAFDKELMPIILARQNKSATKLQRTVIQEESYLQRYIQDHPDILPLDQLDAEARTLVLVREFSTASGSVDAIAIDQLGNVYLIETKLYKNPDKRRVIAQVLDYGAALWKGFSDPDEFIQKLDSLVSKDGQGLRQRLAEFYQLEINGVDELIDKLKSTVSRGNFRFVVLMDTVDDRLKDLITYVNSNSNFDVFGVALDFYQHEDIDILIPTLHGAEVKKTVGGSQSDGRRRWSEESFFADAESRLSRAQLGALRMLFEWSKENADEISYGPGNIGSINPKFFAICSRSIFTARSDGTFRLNFGWLNEPETAKIWRERFGNALRQEGFSIPSDLDERWPSLPVSEWVPRVGDFIRILESYVEAKGNAADLGPWNSSDTA